MQFDHDETFSSMGPFDETNQSLIRITYIYTYPIVETGTWFFHRMLFLVTNQSRKYFKGIFRDYHFFFLSYLFLQIPGDIVAAAGGNYTTLSITGETSEVQSGTKIE